MIYLQVVYAEAEWEPERDKLKRLGEILELQGIQLYCRSEEMPAAEEQGVESKRETKAALWITDNAARAERLCREGKAVLALLHEQNRKQDFSSVLYACEDPAWLDAEYLDRVYRRYAGIPWDILTTERCLLRETMVEDVEAFYRLYREPEITRYTEGLYPDKGQEIAYLREYIDKIYRFYNYGVWTILKKDTGEIIGRAGFSCREGYEEPELGFVIGVPWQRQGYAEEICRGILEYGEQELGFHTVQALVMPENKVSLHLCKKLGFRKESIVQWKGVFYERLVREIRQG